MTIQVARRYKFHAYHALPQLGLAHHEHLYTLEVVMEGEQMGGAVEPTENLDVKVWDLLPGSGADWGNYLSIPTTVENLASYFLDTLRVKMLPVVEVTVWEDDYRWGRARA